MISNLSTLTGDFSCFFIIWQRRLNGAIVPMHNRDIPVGTPLSILEQAGIDKDKLLSWRFYL